MRRLVTDSDCDRTLNGCVLTPQSKMVDLWYLLRKLKYSAIRTATAYLSNTPIKQWKHVRSENDEEQDAWSQYLDSPTEENRKAFALELVDGKSVRQSQT